MDKKAIAVITENLAVREISNEAVNALINDAEVKIRQIIALAQTFMKRSHRKILECKDIKRAMKTLNLDNIYGFPSSFPLKYKRVPGDEDAWYLEDTEIQLSEYLSSKLVVPENYSLHSHWMAIEGSVPNIPENEGEEIEDISYEKAGDSEVNTSHQLSLEQQVYYNSVLEALNSGKRLEAVLDSLGTDSSLTKLIPYISRSMFAMIMDCNMLEVLDRGIKILGSLSLNKHLNLEPYLHQIMPALLSGLMRGDLLQEGHWVFRKNTTCIICKVCDHFTEYYEDLKARVLKLYVKVLEDPTKPAVSHYSAIQGINAFGELCVKNLLVPILPQYINSILCEKLKGTDCALWNMCKASLIVRYT